MYFEIYCLLLFGKELVINICSETTGKLMMF